MYNNNNNTYNLTGPHSTQPQTDIYAILSTDDPSTAIEGPIDTDALVMDIFDTNYSTISNHSTGNNSLQSSINNDHPLSTTSSVNDNNNNNNTFPTPNSTAFSSAHTPNEFNFNQQDFMNFDITTNSPSQAKYTQFNNNSINTSNNSNSSTLNLLAPDFPSHDELFQSFNTNNNFDFSSRRHSVAVSGGLADFNLSSNLSQPNFYNKNRDPASMESPTHLSVPVSAPRQAAPAPPFQNPFARSRTPQLATLVEGETQPNTMHRQSMPNIFLTEESRRQLNSNIQKRVTSLSARTTPTSTPPPVAINFNQMPWSTPNESNNNTNVNDMQPVIGRKRFYSQQFEPIKESQAFQQPSNICPLPMSGIMGRRTSTATPNDIYTWNRMVNHSNDRILLEEQQQQQQKTRRAQSISDPSSSIVSNHDSFINANNQTDIKSAQPPTKKRQVMEEEDTESVTSTEDTSAEDYPAITEADLEAAKKDPNAIPRRQKLRYEGDQYTPKWVRYTGQLKEGYCDTCKPGKWLQLKNSAFWYHKQFFHGISSVSGKTFRRPLEQRAGEHDVVEGLCHQCKQFVPICNSKRKNSVLWYRHAHKCHIYDKPKPKGGKRASISLSTSNDNSNGRFQLNDQLQRIY